MSFFIAYNGFTAPKDGLLLCNVAQYTSNNKNAGAWIDDFGIVFGDANFSFPINKGQHFYWNASVYCAFIPQKNS